MTEIKSNNDEINQTSKMEVISISPSTEKPSPEKDETPTPSTSPLDETQDAEKNVIENTTNPENEERRISLLNSLKSQLEYYFSPANLSKDTFLCSVMSNTRTPDSPSHDSPGKHAPILILSRFGNVKKLLWNSETGYLVDSIPSLLKEAAELSDQLEVVELSFSTSDNRILGDWGIGPKAGGEAVLPYGYLEKNIPKIKEPVQPQPERSTIILRELPLDATEAEVKDIFNWDGCPPVKSAVCDVGYWFITLDGKNEDIISSLLSLRSKKFRGDQPIKARLKTESSTAVKSYALYEGTRNNVSIPEVSGLIQTTAQPPSPSQNNEYPRVNRSTRRSAKPFISGTDTSSFDNRIDSRTKPFTPYSSTDRQPRGANGNTPEYTNHSTYRPKNGAGETPTQTSFIQSVSSTPPPLLESHFPALGGSGPALVTDSPSSPKTLPEVDSPSEPLPTLTAPVSPVNTEQVTVVTLEVKLPTVGGYAAALLKKGTPITPPKGSTSSTSKSPKKIVNTSTKNKNSKTAHTSVKAPKSASTVTTATTNPETLSRATSGSMKSSISSGSNSNLANTKLKSPKDNTVSTTPVSMVHDDSSFEAKSSISSKSDNPVPASLNGGETSAPTVGGSSVWGGKKSFVEVLKLKQQHQLEGKIIPTKPILSSSGVSVPEKK